MKKQIYLCNQVNQPFVFMTEDNDVCKNRYKELKVLFEKESNDVEKIFSNQSVDIYEMTSNIFQKALDVLCDPILLSPSGEQYQLTINSLIDMVEWNKLKAEILSVSSRIIIQNSCVYVFHSSEDYYIALAKWRNKKL